MVSKLLIRNGVPMAFSPPKIFVMGIAAIVGLFGSCFVYAMVGDGTELTVSPVLLKVIEEVEVPALQEGPVLAIHVTEGKIVQVGEPVLQIDNQRAKFKQQQAELAHRIAKKKSGNRADLSLAEIESRVANSGLQRAMESRKRFPDTPSQAEMDDIELRVAQSQKHLEQATNEFQLADLATELAAKNLALASFEVERHQIKSPIQGAVIEILARPGEWVQPGKPLVRVMRIDRLRVEGFLKREAFHPGLIDRNVTVVLEGNEGQKGQHLGKIVFISPVVDPNDRTMRIVAEVDNSKGELGPGLRAKMLIHSR